MLIAKTDLLNVLHETKQAVEFLFIFCKQLLKSMIAE